MEALGVAYLHNDAIVVAAQVAKDLVRRILIDNGSSIDILYKVSLKKINLEGVTHIPVCTPLYGFTGERVYTEGTISLPVTFETIERVYTEGTN